MIGRTVSHDEVVEKRDKGSFLNVKRSNSSSRRWR